MSTKYQPQVDSELIRDIFSARKGILSSMATIKETNTRKGAERFLRLLRSNLGRWRRSGMSPRVLRRTELQIAFLKEIHDERKRKYESY